MESYHSRINVISVHTSASAIGAATCDDVIEVTESIR
jgi:hypothetical protein